MKGNDERKNKNKEQIQKERIHVTIIRFGFIA
jgi:hypothetical protein